MPKNSYAKMQYNKFEADFQAANSIVLNSNHTEDYWYHWLKYIRTGSSLYQSTCSNSKLTVPRGNSLIDVMAYRHKQLNSGWYMTDIDTILYDSITNPTKAVLIEAKLYGNVYRPNVNKLQNMVYEWLVLNSTFKLVSAYKIAYTIVNSNPLIQIVESYVHKINNLPYAFAYYPNFLVFLSNRL